MQRRKLRFDTVDQALAEADRLAAADRQGSLMQHGKWTLGQALGHCAAWASFANEGYPKEVASPPLIVRLIARMLRNHVLTKGMSPGMRIGRLPEGTLAVDVFPTDEGLARFHAALRRLRDEAPAAPNPAFGKLTHQQWIALNLRHAELHFSFLDPG